MGKTQEKLTATSINGAVIALNNTTLTTKFVAHGFNETPHISRLPILNPHRNTIYIPEQWQPATILIKNIILLTRQENPNLPEQGILLSVLPAEQATLLKETHSAYTPGTPHPHLNQQTPTYQPHPTHNLILIWVDNYSTAEAVNRMM